MAEVIQIKFKVDGKQITATEKDLKELEKATKKVQGAAKKSQVTMKGMGKAFVGVATAALAAGAAVLAFGKETLDSTRELQKAITMSGVSAEAFQRQAIAAKSVGIEQDKLGDIYKDVNDKLGDFVATGAGPLADFFDTVGRKVGITIDDFKDLSGDQALGLYVKTLEDANVSQQEMTFLMEALASDSVLLAPLLANNAAEMKRLGDAAGEVLSEEQIENAGRLSAAMDAMANTVGNQLKGAFIDVATEAANFFGLLDSQAQKTAKEALGNLDDNIADLQASLRNLADNEMDAVSKSFAELNDIGFNTKFGRDDEIEDQERLVQILEAKLASSTQAWHRQIDIVAGVNAEVKAQEELAIAARSGQGLGTGAGSGTSVLQAEAARKKATDEKIEQEKRILEIQKNRVAAIKQINAEIKEEKQHIEDLKEKWLEVLNPSKIHKEDIRELQLLLAKGVFSAEQYAEAIRKLADGDEEEGGPFEGLIEELNSIDSIMAETAKNGISSMADAITDMVVTGKADFAGLAKSILSDIARMIIKMLILRAISHFLPGADKGGNVLPQTADHGGTFSAGSPVLIGTGAQPELFVPTTAGTFFPKQQLGGSGGNGVTIGNINVVIKEKDNETGAEQAQRISKAIQRDMRQMVQQEMIKQQRSGNILNPAQVHNFR